MKTSLIFLSLIFTSIVLLCFAPTILSTNWGKSRLEKSISKSFNIHFRSESIHLSWFGKQHLENVSMVDATRNITLHAERITFDFSFYHLLFKHLGNGKTSIENLFFTVGPNKEKPIYSVKDSYITLHTKPSGLFLSLQGKTIRENRAEESFSGELDVEGLTSHHLFSLDPFPKAHVNGHLTNFPVDAFDKLFSLNGDLENAFGKTFDLSVKETKIDKGVGIKIIGKSPTFSLEINGVIENGIFQLKESGKMLWDLTPDSFLSFTNNSSWNLEKKTRFFLSIDKLDLPFLRPSFFTGEDILFNASLTASSFNLINDQTTNNLSIHQVKVNFESEKTNEIAVTGNINFHHPIDDDLIEIGLVPSTHFAFQTNTRFVDTKQILINSASGTVTNGPLSIIIETQPQKKPFHLFNPRTLSLKGSAVIPKLTILTGSSIETLLKDLTIPWSLDGTKNQIQLDIRGKTLLSNQQTPGSIKGSIAIGSWVFPRPRKPSVQFDVLMTQLPPSLLKLFPGQKDIVNFIGPTLDLSLNGNYSYATQEGTLDFSCKGQYLQGKGSLQFDRYLSLNPKGSPAIFELSLTPDRFNALRSFFNISNYPRDYLTLLEPTEIKLEIHSLHLPWKKNGDNWEATFSKAGLQSKIFMNRFRLRDSSSGQMLKLQQITGNLETVELGNQLKFQISADGQADQTKKQSFSLSGSIDNLLTEDESWNLEDSSIKLSANLTYFPASLLCQMLCPTWNLSEKIEALIGNPIDARVKMKLRQMQGPIQALFVGSRGSISFDASVHNGFLFLNHPFVAEFAATKEFGYHILQDMLPILSDIQYAEQPISLYIDPEGFQFPLKSLDFSQIQILNGRLDLGKVQFSGNGELADIVNLIDAKPQKTIPIWFTPFYFSLQKGTLHVQRMDMLFMDQYPLAIWGKIDFLKDKVKMMLGISGEALSKALNLANLDRRTLLQLPIKGKTNNARIDQNQAIARISALAAHSQGTPQGHILGAFLDLTSGKFQSTNIPPPMTKPFPWENSSTQETGYIPPVKKKQPNQANTNPLKKIEKEAENLIKKLIR